MLKEEVKKNALQSHFRGVCLHFKTAPKTAKRYYLFRPHVTKKIHISYHQFSTPKTTYFCSILTSRKSHSKAISTTSPFSQNQNKPPQNLHKTHSKAISSNSYQNPLSTHISLPLKTQPNRLYKSILLTFHILPTEHLIFSNTTNPLIHIQI